MALPAGSVTVSLLFVSLKANSSAGMGVVATGVAVSAGVGVSVSFPGSSGCDIQPAPSMHNTRTPAIRIP